jgi:hypothetical protein
LVARCVRDAEVVGSNPATPTDDSRCFCRSEAPAVCHLGPQRPFGHRIGHRNSANASGRTHTCSVKCRELSGDITDMGDLQVLRWRKRLLVD